MGGSKTENDFEQENVMAITELAVEGFADSELTTEVLAPRLMWLRDVIGPRLERYLGYYRNSTTDLAETLPCAASTSFAVRPFRQYQELGLPARITGFRRAADGAAVVTGAIDVQRKEVVIENDIAWRINTLVEFAANRMPAVTSTATDPETRRRLTGTVRAIFEASGGVGLLQELVLQGAIAGSAWVQIQPTAQLLARLDAARGDEQAAMEGSEGTGGSGTGAGESDRDDTSTGTSATWSDPDVARWFRLEIVKASQLCPLPRRGEVDGAGERMAYAALLRGNAVAPERTEAVSAGILERMRSWFSKPMETAVGLEGFSFDLFGAQKWQRYVRGELMAEGENLLGFVPLVRYENGVDAAAGMRVGPSGSAAVDVGASDVEPLIGLQDELNTRLSDRAYRVTMTSFRMWLGRGIEDFTKRPIGPGQMWSTENPQATIEAFGGDSSTPSEESHIEEVREALDKISGVPPVAAGVLRARLGNLTSAVALRVTLIALLARTTRKRAALERTMRELVARLLDVLDRAGIVESEVADRGVDFNWPSALPENEIDRLTEAQTKLALGVPKSVVMEELGYGELVPAEEK
jgi:hypothetical protein